MTTDTRVEPWRIEAGEREKRTFAVLDEDGAVVDVTGWAIDAAIKDRPGGTVLYSWPPQYARVEGGLVVLDVPAAVSLAWSFRAAYYRVKVINPLDATDVQRVLQGPLVIDPD